MAATNRALIQPLLPLLLLALALALLATAPASVSAQPSSTQPIYDGVQLWVKATVSQSYYALRLQSFTSAAESISPALPPVTIALTNQTAADSWSIPTSATLYVGFDPDNLPSRVNFAYRSTTGLLSIPPAAFVGHSYVVVLVDLAGSFVAGVTQFSITAALFQPVALCWPQLWPAQQVDAPAFSAQFTAQMSGPSIGLTAAPLPGASANFTLLVGTNSPPSATNFQWIAKAGQTMTISSDDPHLPANKFLRINVPGGGVTQPRFVLLPAGVDCHGRIGQAADGDESAQQEPAPAKEEAGIAWA